MSQKMYNIGFIGCGNIGSALMSGLLKRQEHKLGAFDVNNAALDRVCRLGAREYTSNSAVAKNSEIIVLGVKPYQIRNVLLEIKDELTPEKIIVSTASSIEIDFISKAIDYVCPVVRVMPNTMASIGFGVFAICYDDKISKENQDSLESIFGALGTVVKLKEDKLHAFTAILGCGPAYVFYFMDAIAESAVSLGFTRSQASDLVTQLFTGSAKLAFLRKDSYADLREEVCSPGGVTISAINHMDRTAIRGNIIDSVFKAYEKDKALAEELQKDN